VHLETRDDAHDEIPVAPSLEQRRRVRNDAWHLKRRADQRRNRANAIVVGSVVVVLVFVRLLYTLLTR